MCYKLRRVERLWIVCPVHVLPSRHLLPVANVKGILEWDFLHHLRLSIAFEFAGQLSGKREESEQPDALQYIIRTRMIILYILIR